MPLNVLHSPAEVEETSAKAPQSIDDRCTKAIDAGLSCVKLEQSTGNDRKPSSPAKEDEVQDSKLRGAVLFNLGLHGGGILKGKTMPEKRCYESALEAHPRLASAWINLGGVGGGWVGRRRYSPAQCYEMGMKIGGQTSSSAWYTLGSHGGGVVDRAFRDNVYCYERAISLEPENSLAWEGLGRLGGGSVNDKFFNAKCCFVEAVQADAGNYAAWNSLGLVGGEFVNGKKCSPKRCYEITLEAKMDFASAWYNLGTIGGGQIGGINYAPSDCFVKAAEISSNSFVWNDLGATTRGVSIVHGQSYSKKDCFMKALEIDSSDALAWYNLGKYGGGVVRGEYYSENKCLLQALGLNPKLNQAWCRLGALGGGKVGSLNYNRSDCFALSLENKTDDAAAWNGLGLAGGGTVSGVVYNSCQCFEKSVNVEDNAEAWCNLAFCGGGKVDGRRWSKAQCYARALETLPDNSDLWVNCGVNGGGKVGGRSYSEVECYKKALALSPENPQAWRNLGACGGVRFNEHAYSPEECLKQAQRNSKVSVDGQTDADKEAITQILEKDIDNARAWNSLGLLGGGCVLGQHVSTPECFQKALSASGRSIGKVSRYTISSWPEPPLPNKVHMTPTDFSNQRMISGLASGTVSSNMTVAPVVKIKSAETITTMRPPGLDDKCRVRGLLAASTGRKRLSHASESAQDVSNLYSIKSASSQVSSLSIGYPHMRAAMDRLFASTRSAAVGDCLQTLPQEPSSQEVADRIVENFVYNKLLMSNDDVVDYIQESLSAQSSCEITSDLPMAYSMDELEAQWNMLMDKYSCCGSVLSSFANSFRPQDSSRYSASTASGLDQDIVTGMLPIGTQLTNIASARSSNAPDDFQHRASDGDDGFITITIIKALNVNVGRTSLFVTCKVGEQEHPAFSTQICGNCIEPYWNETFSVTTAGQGGTELLFELWQFMPNDSHVLLGARRCLAAAAILHHGPLALERRTEGCSPVLFLTVNGLAEKRNG